MQNVVDGADGKVVLNAIGHALNLAVVIAKAELVRVNLINASIAIGQVFARSQSAGERVLEQFIPA